MTQVDAATWLVGHRYGIWRTTDSGATWAQVAAPALLSNPVKLSDGTLVATHGTPFLRRSVDDGATWTSMATGITATNMIFKIAMTDDAELWAAGAGDLRVRTTDAGASWASLGSSNPDLHTAVAWDADRWLVAGDRRAATRTSDGGSTLTSVALGTTQHIRRQ
ncbi:MAG: hypothetical protein JWO69_606 [Thermoleophilia bacterium]|nr:hypothetical protein [Thermoleophilia bacterium]